LPAQGKEKIQSLLIDEQEFKDAAQQLGVGSAEIRRIFQSSSQKEQRLLSICRCRFGF
jgi:hypothetical protein